MRYLVVFLLPLALLWATESASGREREPKAELSTAQQNLLQNQVILSHEARSAVGILQALQPFVSKITPDQLAAADKFLTGQGIPSIAQLLSGARMDLGDLNQLGKPPTGRELIITLRG